MLSTMSSFRSNDAIAMRFETLPLSPTSSMIADLGSRSITPRSGLIALTDAVDPGEARPFCASLPTVY